MGAPSRTPASTPSERDVVVARARLRALVDRADASAGNGSDGWVRVLNDPEDGDVHVVVWSLEGLVALDFNHNDPSSVSTNPAAESALSLDPPPLLRGLAERARRLLGVPPTSALWIADGPARLEGTTQVFEQYLSPEPTAVVAARWLERDALTEAQQAVVEALEADLLAGDAALTDAQRAVLFDEPPIPDLPPGRTRSVALAASEQAMFAAVLRDDAAALERALEAGVRVDVSHPRDDAQTIQPGETAASLAARKNRTTLVRRLIEAGADMHRSRGRSLLDWAARHGDRDLCELLLELGATVSGEPTPLHHAAHGGSVGAVRALLRAGARLPAPPHLDRLFEIADERGDPELRAELMARTHAELPHLVAVIRKLPPSLRRTMRPAKD